MKTISTKITMKHALAFLVEGVKIKRSFVEDDRYSDINGKTLKELESYTSKYLDTSDRERIVYYSRFKIFADANGDKYFSLYDIHKQEFEDCFWTLAIKLGDEIGEEGIVKVYLLIWDITNPTAGKADGMFDWKDFKVSECKNSNLIQIIEVW